MALTTTYLNQTTLATGASQITLAAYTAPSRAAVSPRPWLKFANGEVCAITDETLSPTLSVQRGLFGTNATVVHYSGEGVQYGMPVDFPDTNAANINQPALMINAQEVTTTGATGTTAAVVTADQMGFLNCTGATGTGLNLPYPFVGANYTIKNNSATGTITVYCTASGATVNGVAGATGVTLTATGNRTMFANCATAGAWQLSGNT